MSIDFKHIKQIYFIGIGGIGMSALAFHFLRQGYAVFGFDRTNSEICKNLESKGAKIEYDELLQLAGTIRKEQSLIIYTPAVKPTNVVYNHFYINGFQLYKRAQILGEISRDKVCIAVAGTHGKTSITSILAFLLKENKLPVTAFLGGVSQNYQSNYVYEGDEVYVIEADEFDRSLLQLEPDYALISNIDADHLDIYESIEDLKQTFQKFSDLVKNKEHFFYQKDLNFEGLSIGINAPANSYAENIQIKDGIYHFDWVFRETNIKGLHLQMPGEHNVFNALGALSLASSFRPDLAEDFAKTLSKFEGVKRRFNYLIKSEDLVIIDDYAHHPSEISAVHQAVRQMYPKEKVMAIFQPHLFSRTRDFADDFVSALSEFNVINLLDIYPAREEPIEGIDVEYLKFKISNAKKNVIAKSEISTVISNSECKIIVMMGAGDIGIEAQNIKKTLSHEK
jgi:UDP-N-acetylmuramate--alanine ligase